MKTNENSFRVLLIEDNPGDIRLISEMLQEAKGRKIVFEHCGTLTEGLQELSKNDFNILLLDLNLPDSEAFDTFVKVYTQNPEFPIIVLTGMNDEELAIKSVRAGAQDYLVKGQIDSTLLSQSISYAIERAGLLRIIQQELIERKKTEQALRESEIALHAILESTADGILAVDKNGKIIKTNKRFADLWRVPETLLNSGDDEALLTFVLDQLIEPEEFFKKVHKLYSSTEEDLDTLLFKDGRIYERSSIPLLLNDSNIGRVWSFRDITERKRAEEVLHEATKEREKLIKELQSALDNIKTLQGLIPMCSNCKKIRDDKGFWNQVEKYIGENTNAKFTHGICPECSKLLYGDLYEKALEKKNIKNI